LELPTNAKGHAALRREPVDTVAIYQHFACRTLAAISDAAEESRLSGSIRPNNPYNLAAVCFEGDTMERNEASILHANIA
jgi:hypothetical protein